MKRRPIEAASVKLGLVFAIASAFLFGSYLFLLKRYFASYSAPVYVCVVMAFGLVWYAPIAAVRTGTSAVAGLSTGVVAYAIGLSLVTVGAQLTFFAAVAAGEVSYVAPLSKVVPLFVLPLEVALLGERLAPLQVAGVLVVTGAIYVANFDAGALLDPFKRAVTTRAAQLALLSAATWGVVDVGRRVLLQELAFQPAVFVVLQLAVIVLALLPLAVRRGFGGVRSDLGKFAGMGLLVALGNHMVMAAFTQLPASIVSPVVNTQAVVAVVLGGVLLGEDAFRMRLLAAGLAVGGVTLITVG
ncbi:DMT family transporter [Haloarculaceae archaeon H-GB1-1]|nr:DMT family transporter [Haloarculaceae archaeon H-GB1-1]